MSEESPVSHQFQFVILRHDHPFVHWDLMLEAGQSLRTWRLHDEPVPGTTTSAESLPDHRPCYLDYEGPVRGDRGMVSQWDRGCYAILRQTDTSLQVTLAGRRLQGELRLCRTGPDPHWVCEVLPASSHPRAADADE